MLGVAPELGRADRLDHARLPIVLAGLGLGPARTRSITTDQEHFGLTGRSRHRRAGRAGRRGRGRDRWSGDAADEADRRLARAVDDRPRGSISRALRAETRLPVLVDGAQSAGAIPVERRRSRLLHRVGAEVAVRARGDRGALRRDPSALAVGAVATRRRAPTTRRAPSCRRRGRRASTRGGCRSSSLAGLGGGARRRVRSGATSRRPRRPRAAAALLEPLVEVVTPPGHSTLVSFRPHGDPAGARRALHERGVIVRELPGREPGPRVAAAGGRATTTSSASPKASPPRPRRGEPDTGVRPRTVGRHRSDKAMWPSSCAGQLPRSSEANRRTSGPSGPGPPSRATRGAGRARRRSAAAPRRPCGCGRRARRRAPRRPW